MKTIHLIANHQEQIHEEVCLSLGCFDGLHLGHQQILQALQKTAQQKKLASCLCIFRPHPLQILKPELEFKTLFTTTEMQELLQSCSLDYLCVMPFDLAFSKLSASDFVSFITKKFKKVSDLIVGYDFSFGNNREGDFEVLNRASQTYGFKGHQISAFCHNKDIVSTSRIKNKLQSGMVLEANALLGYSFFIQALVIKGDGRGRTIGFPTANLQLHKDKFLPKRGVYQVQVEVDNKIKKAVMNLGYRPSFKKDSQISLEVHIPSENLDLYGKTLKVEILSYIREEQAFSSFSELQSQIQADISKALSLG